jgi:hypothetical protein
VLRRAAPGLYLLLPKFFSFYVLYCTFALWAFDMEFWIFFLCMQKGATNEGQIELILICIAFCGLWRGAEGRTAAVRTLTLYLERPFHLVEQSCPVNFKETFVVWGDTGLR